MCPCLNVSFTLPRWLGKMKIKETPRCGRSALQQQLTELHFHIHSMFWRSSHYKRVEEAPSLYALLVSTTLWLAGCSRNGKSTGIFPKENTAQKIIGEINSFASGFKTQSSSVKIGLTHNKSFISISSVSLFVDCCLGTSL